MSLRQECLWEHLTPERPEAPELRGERKVDVCVIGAGITGLSAALHLLEKDQTVCVLEAHATGHGGSGRNVGLVNAGLWIPRTTSRQALVPRSASGSTACSAMRHRWCSR